ncbi:RnfABCDGE type electron transport complex subunit D [Treponema sp. C6A8]|uniref:RnfABCDGE type electron transport complex subunit D n=1 Tax=Treponema sp. C6A8 TaxID=1410609 RepID=UPI000486023B|nr:RnfABCDGE type electron transport complex subunit D [Treponema sp. C6A8]
MRLSSSPHFTEGLTTQKIMAGVLIAMLPECIAGVVVFGLPALIRIVVSVFGCVLFEALFQKFTKQKILVSNLSAAVSGVLLALVLSSTTPIWMVLLGDLVAMVVAKGLFGGIGSNVFNPALTGRGVLVMSFPAAIGARWYDPHLIPHIHEKLASMGKTAAEIDAMSQATVWDGITAATTLSKVKAGTFVPDAQTYWQLFIGNRAGCIGETSIMLLMVSFCFLLLTRIIDWRAPLAMVGTVVVCTFLGGIHAGLTAAGTDVLTALLTGGLIFGATFMVTDYATTPITGPGRLIFGFGCGLITWLIRRFGGYPEGVMFSILIMNAVAPLLNNFTGRMYGYGKKGNRRPTPAKIVQTFDVQNAKPEEVK